MSHEPEYALGVLPVVVRLDAVDAAGRSNAPPMMPMKSAMTVSSGISSTQARNRGTTR